MCIELAQLVKNDNVFSIKKNDIKKYKKVPGVWMMKGRIGKTSEFEYLEVGQSKDIGTELEYNLNLLTKNYSNVNLEKKYVARRLFPKFQVTFNVCKCDKNRRAAKYRTIAIQYDEIIIKLLCKDEVSCLKKREEIEYKYAIDYNAKFWNAWGRQRREAIKYYNSKKSNS